MKQKFYLYTLLIAMMNSCYYEEGPLVSYNTKKNRLSRTWNYEKAIINNLDITDKFKNLELTFTEEHDMIWYSYARDTSQSIDSVYVSSGRWEFNKTDKTKLELFFIDSITLSTSGEVWIIKKLSQKELKLYAKTNTEVIEFTLKATE